MSEEFRTSRTCFGACTARGQIRIEENIGWEDVNRRDRIKVQLQLHETAMKDGSVFALKEMFCVFWVLQRCISISQHHPPVWSDQTMLVLHQLLHCVLFTVSLAQVQSWLPQACCLHHPSFWLVHLSSYGNQYQRSIQTDIWVGFSERNSFFFLTFSLCLSYLQPY